MKRTVTVLAVTAALTLGGGTAAQAHDTGYTHRHATQADGWWPYYRGAADPVPGWRLSYAYKCRATTWWERYRYEMGPTRCVTTRIGPVRVWVGR